MDSSSLILALCVACLIFFLLRNRNKKYENLPPGPSPLPILGNVLQLNMKDLPKSFIKLAKIHGDVFTVHLGRNAVVVLHGYDAVKEALLDNSDIFGDRAKLPAGQLVFKDYGVMLSNGERWRQLRRFSLTTLRNFGMGKRSVEERIQEESRCLVEEFRKKAGSPFDPTYLVTLAVSNVICSIIFGQRFDYEDKNFLGLFAMLKKAFRIRNSFVGQLLNSFPKIIHRLPGPHHQVIQNFFTLNEFVMDKVKEHLKTLDQNCPRDYIDCFLIKMEQEKDNPTTEFVFQNLSVTVINIFLAGTETTSTTIRLGLRILLKYPDVLAKVQEEIDHVIGQNRCPSVEDRSKMPYTDAVIHEIQRITDVLPMSVPHATAKTIVFRGYTIPKEWKECGTTTNIQRPGHPPKLTGRARMALIREADKRPIITLEELQRATAQGTTIFPLLTSVLKDPNYFQNPHKFNPNNFLDEKGGFRKKEAFIPFSTGKRMCLGEGLARMELFLFITTILQNFHLKSDEDPSDIDISPLPDSNSTVHRPYDISLVPR